VTLLRFARHLIICWKSHTDTYAHRTHRYVITHLQYVFHVQVVSEVGLWGFWTASRGWGVEKRLAVFLLLFAYIFLYFIWLYFAVFIHIHTAHRYSHRTQIHTPNLTSVDFYFVCSLSFAGG